MNAEDHAQYPRATESGTGVRPAPELKKRRGAYLPHWTRDNAWYAVTFRLWDSLPQHVIESWLFERKNIVKTAEQMNRPLSKHEERRLAHLYSEKVERYLDAGYGTCYMNDDRVAVVVANALLHFDGSRLLTGGVVRDAEPCSRGGATVRWEEEHGRDARATLRTSRYPSLLEIIYRKGS